MDSIDKKKADREKLLNEVEAYIYKVKELLWTDEIEKYATESDLDQLKALLEKSSEFFEDFGPKAKDEELTKLKTDLFERANPIANRILEADRRPVFLEDLKELISKMNDNFAKLALVIIDTNLKVATFKDARKVLNETSFWLNETIAKQELLQLHDDPVLKFADLEAKINILKPLSIKFDPNTVEIKKRKPDVEKVKEQLMKTGLKGEEIQDMLDTFEQANELKAKNKTDKAPKNETVLEEEDATAPPPAQEEEDDRGEL